MALAKFADPSAELIESLRFVLPADQTLDFSDLRDRVAGLLRPCSVPIAAEREYFRLLAEAIFRAPTRAAPQSVARGTRTGKG